MENHHSNGKTHYKWPFSIAMLNCQRLSTGDFATIHSSHNMDQWNPSTSLDIAVQYGGNGKNCEIEWDICSLPWGNMGISLHILWDEHPGKELQPDNFLDQKNANIQASAKDCPWNVIRRKGTVPKQFQLYMLYRKIRNLPNISEDWSTKYTCFPQKRNPKKDRKGSIYHNLSLLSSVF